MAKDKKVREITDMEQDFAQWFTDVVIKAVSYTHLDVYKRQILRRAKNFKNICEHIAIRIDDGEVIVGAQSSKYRACALYPENSVEWLKQEVENDYISTRGIDPYILCLLYTSCCPRSSARP